MHCLHSVYYSQHARCYPARIYAFFNIIQAEEIGICCII